MPHWLGGPPPSLLGTARLVRWRVSRRSLLSTRRRPPISSEPARCKAASTPRRTGGAPLRRGTLCCVRTRPRPPARTNFRRRRPTTSQRLSPRRRPPAQLIRLFEVRKGGETEVAPRRPCAPAQRRDFSIAYRRQRTSSWLRWGWW